MTNKVLCPFSKPIIGNWCQCEYANLEERCSGKMSCIRAADLLPVCQNLVSVLKKNSCFVLGISDSDIELTHAQLMKIRCGGLLGMRRVLKAGEHLPDVVDIINQTELQFGSLTDFPFSEIMPDIKAFSHRVKRAKKIDAE